jgi:hypothetical protein
MEFTTLKEKFESKKVTLDQYEETTENANVEDNGASGQYIDCNWYTATELNGEDKFDFYVPRNLEN